MRFSSTGGTAAASLNAKTIVAPLRSTLPRNLSRTASQPLGSVRCTSRSRISWPRVSPATLSTSSQKMTGLVHSASMAMRARRPYVELWYERSVPIRCVASLSPPSATVKNGASTARASPRRTSVVLPFPAGPWMPTIVGQRAPQSRSDVTCSSTSLSSACPAHALSRHSRARCRFCPSVPAGAGWRRVGSRSSASTYSG